MATITAMNAVFMLSVAGLFPTPQKLSGFGVDDAFTAEVADTAEVQVGVDGFGVAGYVPRLVPMTIRFLASARSIDLFENWIGAQDAAGEILYGSAVISQPSIGRKYTCYMGVLSRINTMADVRKVLGNREFHLNWLPQGIVPAISEAPM